MSKRYDEGGAKPTQEEPAGTGGSNTTQKPTEEDGAHEMAALLREHLPASLSLEYATLLIAIVTIIFALFLPAFGYFEWARFKKLEREVQQERRALQKRMKRLPEEREQERLVLEARIQTLQEEIAQERQTLEQGIERFKVDLETQRQELTDERRTLGVRVETFKVDLNEQEQRLVGYQRFLEAVLSHHSDLLVGITEGFGSALKPNDERRLRSLISEAEAALYLFHPDKDEVVKALLRLEQIGADNAVPSLARLRDDSTAEADIRVRAQRVLSRIQERLRAERKETPPPVIRSSNQLQE